MKIDNKKINRMRTILYKLKVNKHGLTPDELEELKELSSYFLFIAVASDYTSKKHL